MIEIRTPSQAKQARIFPLFTMLGWLLLLIAISVGVFTLAPTAADYFGSNAKVLRDAAESGSVLLGQLQTLQTTSRWLEPLAFVGMASFMVGIAMAFSTIPDLLKNRGQVMSACFPVIAEKGE